MIHRTNIKFWVSVTLLQFVDSRSGPAEKSPDKQNKVESFMERFAIFKQQKNHIFLRLSLQYVCIYEQMGP